MIIDKPCIVPNMNEKIYHADPCPTPSGSRGFLNTMVRKNPLHAMVEHPRLNAEYVESTSTDFDLGSAAHDYVLRGGTSVAVLDFKDWRTDAAKAERAAAMKLGKCPILKHKFEDVKAMEKALRRQISMVEGHEGAFQKGNPECAIFWKELDENETEIWFRTMPDWINDDGWIDDYKTTGIGGPQTWMDGTFVEKGYGLQAYMALRGYHAVTGQNAKGVRFWVQEVEWPFCVYLVMVDATMMECAEQDFEHGKYLFGRCMKNLSFPAYSTRPYVVYPGYKANKNFEDVKVARNTLDAKDGNIRKVMMDWFKPLEGKAA